MSEQKRPFPKMEEEILTYWEKHDIFQKTLDKDAPQGDFVFYEGPPTANGKPGIHHIEARAFKDVIPRYRTMRGYRVRRKGGWDTHGLPVELEVEKQLGLTSKKDIEDYGVETFNAECKKSVWKYLEDWQKFTRRIAYWVDLEQPYVTYEPKYIESLWAIVKKVWDDGLLYKDYKVLPWCPRCGTALSSHELAQGYKDVKELSVTAKFELEDEPGTFLLAWTTTPWTLPGNVGLAVGLSLSYSIVRTNHSDEKFIVASDLVDRVMEDAEVVGELQGKDLVGKTYKPLYPFLAEHVTEENKAKLEEHAYKVYAADFVTTEDGTGIVHTAVMYGQDDFVLGTEVGLPKQHLVNLDGTFMDNMDFLSGRFVKEEGLDVDIIKDLAKRNLLFSKAKYEHSYPHCWRCKTALIYYARDSWYIKMSGLREKMMAENKEINWEPSHIRDGRFGEWLDGVKDWAISRERYWATPLPIWESEDGERVCIGSFEELRELAKDPAQVGDEFDPHRPFVDEIVLEKEGKEYRRVPEVMDVWFDSGAMPFAQDHFPFEHEENEPIGGYPADYISEAIDQTRGWFYTLHAVGALMGKGKAFKNVICLGHILDAEGKKMSKSVGNVVDPWEMIERYGVDALRYWMYTVNQPGESKNFDEKHVDDIVKKRFMILMNVKSFYEMYAGSEFGVRSSESTNHEPRTTNVLDRWILARLNQLISESTEHMDTYRVLEPARAIGEFITDLSQWYVRRSRDRFKGDDEDDKRAAMATLRHVLLELSKLMAPFTPFIAEKLYQDLGGDKESVHLEDWPTPIAIGGAPTPRILEEMKQAREIVTMALERRATEKIPVRQPLASLTISMEGELSDDLKAIIADEVNVKQVEVVEGGEVTEVELDLELTSELVAEGIAREVVRRTNSLRKQADLTIEDVVTISIGTQDAVVKAAVDTHREEILKGTIAKDISVSDALDGEAFKIHGGEVVINIKT